MSLHDYFLSLGVSSSGRALLLRGLSTGQAESRKLVLETGYEVIARIHRGLKLPTSALVATVLLHNTSGLQMGEIGVTVHAFPHLLCMVGGDEVVAIPTACKMLLVGG